MPWWQNRVERGNTAGHIKCRPIRHLADVGPDLRFGGGAGWTRTSDRRIMSLISATPLTCRNPRKAPLTCGCECSTFAAISHVLAVRRGTHAGHEGRVRACATLDSCPCAAGSTNSASICGLPTTDSAEKAFSPYKNYLVHSTPAWVVSTASGRRRHMDYRKGVMMHCDRFLSVTAR